LLTHLGAPEATAFAVDGLTPSSKPTAGYLLYCLYETPAIA